MLDLWRFNDEGEGDETERRAPVNACGCQGMSGYPVDARNHPTIERPIQYGLPTTGFQCTTPAKL